MRKIILFMMVSLDGYFEGSNHDIGWHNVDEEFNTFAAEQMNEAGALLFGRRTYELMASYWPTHVAAEGARGDAYVADKMNTLPKVVFSRTLEGVTWSARWSNISLIRDNVNEEVSKLKQQFGKDLVIFGSNNLSVELLKMGLLDEIRVMVNPVVIGRGSPLFVGLDKKLNLKLMHTKVFGNGNVLLSYQPIMS